MILTRLRLICVVLSFGCVGPMTAPLAFPREPKADLLEAMIRRMDQERLKILKSQYDRNMKEREQVRTEYDMLADLLKDLTLVGGVELGKDEPTARELLDRARQWIAEMTTRLNVLQAESNRLEAAMTEIENSEIKKLEQERRRLERELNP